MAYIVLVQARPRNATTGAPVDLRLAGGGRAGAPYRQLGFSDWRAGVSTKPRYTTEIGFDDTGWTGGAVPQTAAIGFAPHSRAYLNELCALKWEGAEVTIVSGDDEKAIAITLQGRVESFRISAGAIAITIGDLTQDLSKPVCPDTFAGTGNLEGGTYATGRVKRRTWGHVFNVEGRLLDQANNIYEFGDPNRPLQSFPVVKDKGRSGPLVVLGWQGSAQSTLVALRAATAPQGGAVVAPSIACVKWWTTAAGPLTADIEGETGTGYVNTAPAIVARLVATYSNRIGVANQAEALGWQGNEAGIHVDDESTTVAATIDRLTLPIGMTWIMGSTGALTFRRFAWTAPVEALRSVGEIERETVYRPLKSRIVGYQRNYREHTDAEISAALLIAGVDTDATRNDDATNLIPSPIVLDQTVLTGGAYLEVIPGAAGRTADKYRVRMNGASNGVALWAGSSGVPAGANETLHYRHTVYANSTGMDTSYGAVQYQRSDGSIIGAEVVPGTLVGSAEVSAGFVYRGGAITTPPGCARVVPYAFRSPFMAGNGDFLIGEPYLGRSQPGSDVTALNQHSLSDVPDIVIAANYQGVVNPGEVPRSFSVRRYLGTVDVSAQTNFSTSSASGAALTVNNTSGNDQRGTVTIPAGYNANSDTITITTTYLGVVLYKSVAVTKSLGPAPAAGGGGGGGNPGGAASSSGPFSPPSTGGYVVTATLAAVVVGSSGVVRLATSLSFNQEVTASETDYTAMVVKWQASINGAAFVDITTIGSNVSAQRYFNVSPPKGLRATSGSHSSSADHGGLTSGASVVYRIATVGDPAANGVTGISGNISATPQ